MGKAGRAKKHTKRMAEKRRAKVAKRALYASRAGTSAKGKKTRARSRIARSFNYFKHAHRMANCGNPGCKKCGLAA